MNTSWYKRIFPKVSEVAKALPAIAEKLLSIPAVREVRVWGFAAGHRERSSLPVRDLDIIVAAGIPSEDLLSITGELGDDLFSLSPDALEEEGYNPEAITFTNRYVSCKDYNMDHWCISADNVLMHFGPITSSQSEWGIIRSEAEEYAVKVTKISMSEIHRCSRSRKSEWYWNYKKFVDMQLEHMPGGWYSSQTSPDEILSKTVLIASKGK